jgi:DNA-binding transcriptional regulator YiaG
MTANELKEARLRLGLSIQQMAGAMGVHRQTWTKWERGERAPDNAALRLIEALQFMSERGCLAEFVKRKQGT